MPSPCDRRRRDTLFPTPWWFKLLMFLSMSVTLLIVGVVIWAIVMLVNMLVHSHT